MNSKFLLTFSLFLYFSSQASSTELASGKGFVIGKVDGIFHIGGHELKAFKVKNENNKIQYLLITSYTNTLIENGEPLIYNGKITTINDLQLINTVSGYIYRPKGLTHEEKYAKEAKEKPPAEIGIPVRAVLTKEQERHQEDRESFEKWMQILSLLIALLAIDKALHLLKYPWTKLMGLLRSPKP
ncbi:hypothetical protein [Sessilibacter corallicola]|uniref:hypothetical protein n=1 Tax=Sessilibacter corallicola TaxID=2904075 RepID=UPI001E6044D6|nr:hypothetical protein [Sessilibacter corallicola]MCE2030151.1 hypothetical protein [Sessilibacter corallicola]